METTILCPHCGRELSVNSEHYGVTVECPLCTGQIIVEPPLAPAPRRAAPPQSSPIRRIPQSTVTKDRSGTKITLGIVGMLFFGIAFIIDEPDHAKITQLERQWQEENALGERFSNMGSQFSNLAPYVPRGNGAQTYRDAGEAYRLSAASTQRCIAIDRELAKARSTNRGWWAFGFVVSIASLISGILYPRSKDL